MFPPTSLVEQVNETIYSADYRTRVLGSNNPNINWLCRKTLTRGIFGKCQCRISIYRCELAVNDFILAWKKRAKNQCFWTCHKILKVIFIDSSFLLYVQGSRISSVSAGMFFDPITIHIVAGSLSRRERAVVIWFCTC